ncbi:MAG: 2-oxoisovalerate dehydrogenase [Defluviitaleaceae bacterium]|nr:2-oxoisovalerate dehydrogenase [Defluviitaleaceae bacterium]MCL2274683.1 2-oxoisovalerate dehydrogenase [Defluviitaleaceae bacterium]MCL2275756.1 2-oxoisovalerate dehydrogenase [Defluviitaleaceae bacterium]
MKNEIIFTVTESLDGGYEAQALGHAIFTQCDNYNELGETLRDAVQCHFDEIEMPKIIRIHFTKDELIAV